MNRPASTPRAVAGHNIPLGEDMSITECTGAGCVTNHEAIAELLDGPPISAGIAAELEQTRLLAARLLDQVRFQHEVLAEIQEQADPNSFCPLVDLQMIRIKAQVALQAAANSGLLP